jgi:glycosyltransferase involved in cell wall biosynthesis
MLNVTAASTLLHGLDTVSSPLVSILTPVYNGAEYLAECIESVLAQTYSNWDYTIVDNCSTDESYKIAETYAAMDPRIRVLRNGRFLSIIENHNHMCRQVSPGSKYCKIVFAEDWIYPPCIEEMVRMAERHPSVGLVGGYTMDGRAVLWPGPPHPANTVRGFEVCRDLLLGGPYVLGSMTSLLLRSDLVRKQAKLFDEQSPHREIGACFELLRESDYAYVHQVLSFSRPRTEVAELFAKSFQSCILGSVVTWLKYGPIFLNNAEYNRHWRSLRWGYHRIFARSWLRCCPRQFWKFHKDTLKAFGGRIDRGLLTACVIVELAARLARPVDSIRAAWRLWSGIVGRHSSEIVSVR